MQRKILILILKANILVVRRRGTKILKISLLINSHGNSDIPGSEAVENVASSQSLDIIECDDFVDVANVETPKKKSKKTREPKIK
ncbi:hypothetical protein JTB14_026136 [Gonioctena quinquepunctata]|nr:hypothetical protein JTB14_022924 [Gonioctena quinquepunctata]KAG5894605.1 hypothetical protein JTB14_026136 [Gonioctena quinquepunctata]